MGVSNPRDDRAERNWGYAQDYSQQGHPLWLETAIYKRTPYFFLHDNTKTLPFTLFKSSSGSWIELQQNPISDSYIQTQAQTQATLLICMSLYMTIYKHLLLVSKAKSLLAKFICLSKV